jgi:N2,N2-dimethylguanosine tRNA methyltransferase
MEKFLMDSDVLSRRALLAGAVSLGASSLLAACGQQANNEVAATASAVPSETASASAVATDSPSASATPSTVRGYSGGSKAPDGEYRPADKYGNAQNVPKPTAPEEGYNEKSLEGLRKTMDAWILWGNYGTQTGDYSMARKFISPNFKRELEEYEDAEKLYQSGGWIIGGIDHFLADGNPWSEDGETYFWKAYREWDREIFVESDGSWVSWTNDDKTDDTFKFELKHDGQKWEIMGYESVDK